MATPRPADLRLAAEWLRAYEDQEDTPRLDRVAGWLDEQADAQELRAAAREHGVSVQRLRTALNNQEITK